jgi:hypothetical protein
VGTGAVDGEGFLCSIAILDFLITENNKNFNHGEISFQYEPSALIDVMFVFRDNLLTFIKNI